MFIFLFNWLLTEEKKQADQDRNIIWFGPMNHIYVERAAAGDLAFFYFHLQMEIDANLTFHFHFH